MNTLIIIPARWKSSRFEGKPLAMIMGREMVLHVADAAKATGRQVCIAADDVRILDAVAKEGYDCMLTSTDCKSGTERVIEAYNEITTRTGEIFDIVVNLQGDEPTITPEHINLVVNTLRDADPEEADIATLAYAVRPSLKDYDTLRDPNIVKVAVGEQNRALYFSRALIPFSGNPSLSEEPEYHLHIGIYAFRPDVLRAITSLKPVQVEFYEKLEQLRWLANGFKIKVGITETPSIGVNIPSDMEKAASLMQINRK